MKALLFYRTHLFSLSGLRQSARRLPQSMITPVVLCGRGGESAVVFQVPECECEQPLPLPFRTTHGCESHAKASLPLVLAAAKWLQRRCGGGRFTHALRSLRNLVHCPLL